MNIDKGDKMALTTKSGETVIVRLEVNPRAKRLILRLDEKRREAVAIAPSRRKLGEAAGFARDRVDWIARHLDHLPDQHSLGEGAVFPLRGALCRITSQGSGRLPVLEPGDPALLRVPGQPETTPRRVERYLKSEARADLTRAVERYCDQLGVAARKVTIKDTRSRWGSCTSDGRLAFSWRLILAPPAVLDYVAAHECAHLLEMNHSPAFWAHVARCRPAWKAERNWLRRHARDLHAYTV